MIIEKKSISIENLNKFNLILVYKMNKENQPHMNTERGKNVRHGIIKYPDVIGSYTFKKTIGEGAYSLVKLAYNDLYHQYYACKIVPIKMLQKRKLYERFELEIRILQQMRHPGVAAITDVLKDENNFYVFMEYYPNGNLFNYIIKKSKLSEDEAKCIIYQIFDALNYINSHGVAHRDIKPENIIFDNNGHIRISDFGLSQYVGENNLVKTLCGSPCYVSPEIISGKVYNGFISDIWSCGVTLYIMVTGLIPWTKNKNTKDLFLQIRIGDYHIPPYVSEQCANMIYMLLRVDPKKRITLDEAMHHTWFNIKSEDDKKTLLNYSIPIELLHNTNSEDFLRESIKEPNQVPYLSIKKIDNYFGPDADCDFYYQFDNINIHEIKNSSKKEKCEVSSPYLNLDNAIKILGDQKNNNLKLRKRFQIQKDEINNFDLADISNVNTPSFLSEQFIVSKKIPSKINNNSAFQRTKSDIVIKSITKESNKDNHVMKNKKIFENRYRNSAKLPKPFEQLGNQQF